ncbi:flavin-containing monooxygenase [Paenibacillus sp. GCM10012307]|uniref:NAD(P)-binding domain-containing protein n=1 Tax=Paenibacillus roseus TaxID=2798579 RepID=A0A934MMK3_9BACL|nr:NAD(P)/FAD-dependent oxidoreductase [Paenibacillus roseus]MBJ6360026.1 NAD(P)-binding domain-containing protein [Paenibacillus roseus]
MSVYQVDTLVIGAGQAGLSIAYFLKKYQHNFIIIDQGDEIGEVWRKRYDSLILFTPRWYSSLPGLPLEGDAEGCATKDEISDYLKKYVETFNLPVHLRTNVHLLKKTPTGFVAETSQGTFISKKVIIATGPFQKPFFPVHLSESLPGDVLQLHSSHYSNSNQLKNGNVLIVGAGNSGAQIAVELANEREVWISSGHSLKYMPVRLFGKSIFWWFRKAGILKASIDSVFGQALYRRPDPIFGQDLKLLINDGKVRMKPRAIKVVDGEIEFEDQSCLKFNNIIWATGFYSDYSWLDIPEALNEKGKPIHDRGISSVANLFFLGLPWQYRRGSALIGGVGEDAKYVMDYISRN